ncbi:MAG: AEC family transporter [Selenomonadaceae bacterium]|nr:AEC family transporter [Selenomonadaceae bacterium]
MFSNFIVAVSAVVPMFCLMAIGAFVKFQKWLTEEELNHMNRMVFRVFFCCMMFHSIYTTELATSFRPKLMLFGACGVLIIFFLLMLIIPRIEPDNKRRGVLVQAIFRSNFVLMGVPIVANIFGDENIAVSTMMIAIIVPMYNILAVFALETFRGGKFALLPILKDIFKNPMILGGIAGATLLILGVEVPKPVLKPIGQISAATTPVALIILGASFRLGATHEHRRQLLGAVFGRLILVPAVMLSTAAYVFGFTGIEFVTLIAIFASPCAVVSFAMAQQMGGDSELAANCVVFTSGLSCLTIFCWILLFKTLGVF